MLKRQLAPKTLEEIKQERTDQIKKEETAFREHLEMEARGGAFASVQFFEAGSELDEEANKRREAAIQKADEQRKQAMAAYVEANMCYFKPSPEEAPHKTAHTQAEARPKRAGGAGEPLTVQTKPHF